MEFLFNKRRKNGVNYKKVGRFFQSHKVETDSPIFAKEKSEEFIAKDNIEQITDFYTLAGHTESAAREKAITYISERDDTYQKAIAKVYDVTDEKFWAYLEKLKNYKQSNLLELKKNSIKSYANENFTFSFH